MLSLVVCIVSSPEAIGVGMKNLGLETIPGFGDGIEGDWNKFVAVPPPLLNVSTYLRKWQYNNIIRNKIKIKSTFQVLYNIEQYKLPDERERERELSLALTLSEHPCAHEQRTDLKRVG